MKHPVKIAHPRMENAAQLDMADEWVVTTTSLLDNLMVDAINEKNYVMAEDLAEDIDISFHEMLKILERKPNITLEAFARILFTQGYRITIEPNNKTLSGSNISYPIYDTPTWTQTSTIDTNKKNESVEDKNDSINAECYHCQCHGCHFDEEKIEDEISEDDPDIQNFLSQMKHVVENNQHLKDYIKSSLKEYID